MVSVVWPSQPGFEPVRQLFLGCRDALRKGKEAQTFDELMDVLKYSYGFNDKDDVLSAICSNNPSWVTKLQVDSNFNI